MLNNNYIILLISGKNINNFIKKLIKLNINVYEIKQINYKKIMIKIDKSNFEKVNKIKGIYTIKKLKELGFSAIKTNIIKNYIYITSLLIFFLFIIILSNIMTQVEIIHNDALMRELIKDELFKYNIKSKTWKKDFNSIQKIKSKILNLYKDQLEWLEIEVIGTKYTVRIIERKQNQGKKTYQNQNIVAKKNAIIKKIIAQNGEIVKEINTYVSKGETIISGELKIYDQVKNITSAIGNVYGEVWYKVNIKYPLTKYELVKTGNQQKKLNLKILNKSYNLFDFSKYNQKLITKKTIFKSNLLPIYLNYNLEEEATIISEINTVDEAIIKAVERSKKELNNKLKSDERIVNYKKMDIKYDNKYIDLNIFFTVYENITEYKNIEIENL